MILTHGANSLKRGDESTVTIGGREYPVVKIGNQLWMAENLDWKWDGLFVGRQVESSSEPRANYYDNNETAYGVNGNKYGLLYNWLAVKMLLDDPSMLPNGWRVPTKNDFLTLFNAAGYPAVQDTSASGEVLKSTTGWSSGNGTDSFGFKLVPAGYTANNSFFSLTHNGYIHTSTVVSETNHVYCRAQTNTYISVANSLEVKNQLSIRLVKDA